MTNLRQQIEEAIDEVTGFPVYKDPYRGGINKRLTDRICSAIKAKVEEMEMLEPFAQDDINPLTAQLKADQEYLMGELKEA